MFSRQTTHGTRLCTFFFSTWSLAWAVWTPLVHSLIVGYWCSFSLGRITQAEKLCWELCTYKSGQLYKPHKKLQSVHQPFVTLDSFSRGLMAKWFSHSKPNIWNIQDILLLFKRKVMCIASTIISSCALIILCTMPFSLLFTHFVSLIHSLFLVHTLANTLLHQLNTATFGTMAVRYLMKPKSHCSDKVFISRCCFHVFHAAVESQNYYN